jgi:translocation and assembly module TamB
MTAAPRKHRLRGWLAGIALLLCLLIGGLVALGTTPAGARMLARLAMRFEPRLSLQVDSGSLWRGLQLSQIAWKDAAADITLASLDTQWKASFSPEPQLDLQRAHAEGLRVHLQPAPAATNAPTQPTAFRFPIHLVATDVQLRDAAFHRESLSINLEAVSLAGEAEGNDLTLTSLHLQDLHIDDARPEVPAPEPTEPWFERLDPANRSAITLPTIHIPLNLHIAEGALTGTRYSRGDATQQMDSLQVSADLVDQKLTVRKVDVESAYGNLQGNGFIQLTGDMPLDLNLQIQTEALLPSNAVTLDAALKNSLAELDFALTLDGPTTLSASGRIQPLDPRLPVKASLTWTNAQWPLDTTSVVASKSGTLSVDGSLDSYTLGIEGDVTGPSIPESRWTLHGTGTLHQFDIDRLRGELLNGVLEAAGTVGWTHGLNWEVTVSSEAIDGQELHASAPSNITAQIFSTGIWQHKEWATILGITSASGDWNGFPFMLNGILSGSSQHGWATPGLTVGVQSNTLDIAGTIDDEIQLSGSIRIPEPGIVTEGLTGNLVGTWSVKGPLTSPDITASLTADQIAIGDSLSISNATLNATVNDLALSDSQLQLDLHGLTLSEQTNLLENLTLTAKGTRAAHTLTLEMDGTPATVSMEVQGSLAEQSAAWTGKLHQAAFSLADVDWALVDHLRIRWDPVAQQLTAAPHRWTHNQAELRVTEPLLLGATGNAQLTLAEFDLTEFHPWLPERLRVKGLLGASTQLQWKDKTLQQAQASLDIQQGAVRLIPAPSDLVEDTPPIDIQYDTVHLDTELVATNWTTSLSIASDHLGAVRARTEIALTTHRTLGDWSGQIEVETVKLELVAPFLTSLRTLSGELNGDIQLSGSPREPILHGSLSLTNGTIEPMEWPVHLGDIHLQTDLQGDQAQLTGGFRSGTGLGSLTGQLQIDDQDWDATLQLTGDSLALSYDSFVVFQASPDLTLRIRPKQFSLDGSVLIPEAEIQIQKLPDSAVRVSPDAVIINGNGEDASSTASNGLSDWQRAIDVELQLGTNVALSGYGITSLLAGQLRIRQTGTAAPSANGEIRLETGKFDAYGQELYIRTGQFLFAGPLNRPTLYVEAVRDVTDYLVTVGLRIEGPIDALRTTLFSQPTMPQEEILPYLLLGRPLEPGDGGAADGMLTSAAISLGLSQGRGHAKSLAESIGIEDFQVGTQGSGDSTEIVVSGRVSPRLQVSYGSSVFAEGTTLTLRYRLAKNLFLETVSSIASSLELLYSFDY